MIGPTFSDELAAAGLSGLPFSWGSDGRIEFAPECPEDKRAAIEALAQAHDGGLAEAKQERAQEAKSEAEQAIAALFGEPTGSMALVIAMLEALAEQVILGDRVGIKSDEEARLLMLKRRWEKVHEIRQTQVSTLSAIEAAKSEAEVPRRAE